MQDGTLKKLGIGQDVVGHLGIPRVTTRNMRAWLLQKIRKRCGYGVWYKRVSKEMKGVVVIDSFRREKCFV